MTTTNKKKQTGPEAPKAETMPEPYQGELLMGEENEAGTIRISENVIAAVVRKYTLEVEGVIGFAGAGFVGGLTDMITRRHYEHSVTVDLDGEAVNISVTLVLEFGVRIPEVAQGVQETIRTRVEELTGKQVTKVEVIIQDLQELPVPGEEPVPEEAAE
ncbi:MAG: Asp23/Gls24 family envelope stress response protein [Lentisphaerae bacterium]|jgi:uncharacterized alkaline shock family protein YloU|nr:Asp23/Gls24 family envelope stress response protein [Lentisphaerota bacterium]MBT4819962.1 Asp23/Gls24 family envelope stress response protein [Lentisphaerota bacterium]MBT5610046.1 Asp23/Gls24 family envelope stress response protein [Lentisphaerota bacterium]MBT7055554.1 Asp23/Gls24 family envelope stress response protein [Lentisphaerota bacterium]MBT7841491.1 Asp23/Gls24 family envelope stress response protein [Lentisphaerota bacterium]